LNIIADIHILFPTKISENVKYKVLDKMEGFNEI